MSSTRTEISCGTKGRIHQVLDCSPTNRERELGLDRRETVRIWARSDACARRPSVGASAPKGTCRWLSPFGGSAVRTALNYNYHRVAGRILCRRLKYATGIVSGRVALLPRSTEIQPFVAKIRASPFPITCSSPKR
ncbi:hypothetical protein YC2023_072027 [Brassica napus]